MASEIVFTRKARCRDCHRCLRACPVKAIRVHDGQAQVVAERCIACGTCIRECPQKAKAYRNDVAEATRLLADSRRVVASIAPSYAGIYDPWERKRLPSALRRLGFAYVAETAVAAGEVAKAGAAHIQQHPTQSHVWASCPAVIQYLRCYRPQDAPLLVPIASPMLAHARWLRERLGQDIRVIFIGPCVAKKAEAERPECKGAVDVVLTFEELAEWLTQESITLDACEESHFDESAASALLYPLPDGALKTAGMLTRDLGCTAFSAAGFEEVERAVDLLAQGALPRVLEPLFCQGGCINGPAANTDHNLYARRFAVEEHASVPPESRSIAPATAACLVDQALPTPSPALADISEAAISEVLAATGKAAREDQLDCGACGYASCRDKAKAVVRGMAEPDMCIPRMRRLAEIRTDSILEASPNGVLLLDAHFHILSMNPAFRRYFRSGEAMLGKHISELMDPEPFLRLAATDKQHLELTVQHQRYDRVCHQILYRLQEIQQYVGFFVDITESKSDQEKLEKLRAQTIVQAQELLDHQVAIAQQLAQFLGESTAKGEILVENLVKLADKPRDPGNDPVKKWRWNTSTSK
jgi:iron only hydrogenase large subunit-like protein